MLIFVFVSQDVRIKILTLSGEVKVEKVWKETTKIMGRASLCHWGQATDEFLEILWRTTIIHHCFDPYYVL